MKDKKLSHRADLHGITKKIYSLWIPVCDNLYLMIDVDEDLV